MLILFGLLGWLGCPTDSPPEDGPEADPTSVAIEAPRYVTLFGVVPDDMHEEEVPPQALVQLGRMLYHDARLSKDQLYSCNSCHDLARYGTSPAPTSGPATDDRPARNAPSTLNAALQFRAYWDGRAASLEEQTLGVFTDPQQMAMPTQTSVLHVIQEIPGYRDAFAAAFPGDRTPIRFGTVAKALNAFQRTLVTPRSKLDRYLGGEDDVLTVDEMAGFDLFVSTGCVSCHSGALLGGGMFQRLGAVHPYETEDPGRELQTGEADDRNIFRVPSLRNVAETGPWMHDGSIATLDEVVRRMAHHQLGRDLSDDEVASIVLFLRTLTGELPAQIVAVPELP